MSLEAFLSVADRLALRKLPVTIKLRRQSSCLILIGAQSAELAQAFNSYFKSSTFDAEEISFYTPASDQLLQEIVDRQNVVDLKQYLVINLFDGKQQFDISKISPGLLLYRDFIPEYQLKLILILSHDMMEYVRTQAYDFFFFNNFARFFFDHKFRHQKQVINTESLESRIKKLEFDLNQKESNPNQFLYALSDVCLEIQIHHQTQLIPKYARKYLDLAIDCQDKYHQAQALSFLGSYGSKNDINQSLNYFSNALTLWRELKHKAEEIQSLNNISYLYGCKEEYEKGITFANRALNLAKEIFDHEGEAEALKNLGFIHWSRGDWNEGITYLHQSLDLAEKKGLFALGVTSGLLGTAYMIQGDCSKGEGYLNQALNSFIEYEQRMEEAWALSSLGFLFANVGDLYHALEHYDRAIALYEEMDQTDSIFQLRVDKGQALMQKGELKEAEAEFEACLSFFEKTESISNRVLIILLLGTIQKLKGCPETAQIRHQEAQNLVKNLTDSIEKITILLDIGKILLDQGQLSPAHDTFLQAKTLIDEQVYLLKLPEVLNSLGEVYQNKKDFKSAEKYFEEALKLNKEMGRKKGEADSLMQLGITNRLKKELNSSLSYLKQAFFIYHTLDFKLDEIKTLTELGKTWIEKKVEKKALHYLNKGLALSKKMGVTLFEIKIDALLRRLSS